MSRKDVAGLSLSVVSGDTDKLAKGYGVKRRGTEDNVTDETLFYIASTTKAITASVLIETMLQNNVSLTRPVKEILTEFQVADYYRQQEATVGDLLSHRMGIPESLYNWLLGGVTDSRLDIVKRALYFKPLLPFRDSNYYSNMFYIAAGLVTEALSGAGQTWEDVVRKTLFTPSQMDDSSFLAQLTAEQLTNLVTPYEPDWRNNFVMREVSMDFFKNSGLGAPSGDIVSNAKDLTKWLHVLTHNGLNENGERVLSEEVFKETMSPHAITGPQTGNEPFIQTSETYGYGWYTGFYKGYRTVFHAGYNFGFHSLATVYPELKIGVFTCINGQNNEPGDMADIHKFIAELILNPPTTSMTTSYEPSSGSQNSPLDLPRYQYLNSITAEASSKQLADEFLDQFIGVYGNFAYGNVTITFDGNTGRLHGEYGDISVDMVHLGNDWFAGRPSDVIWFFPPLEMTFTRNAEDNSVINVTIPIFLEIDPPVFTRGLTMDQAPPPPTCAC